MICKQHSSNEATARDIKLSIRNAALSEHFGNGVKLLLLLLSKQQALFRWC
jgi:hypothetical protein